MLCAKTYGIPHIILYEIAAIAFALLFVLLVMKFTLKNPVLQYMGGNAMFSIYVLQRLPMSFGMQTSLLGHPIMFFLFIFATTIILGWLFDQTIDRTLRRLIHKH
jgi:peptidoglycan/LPS O-acetylase OafA/YrhL